MLSANQIRKSFGDSVILENVSFNLNPGDRAGLIGPNGCGKTTLLRILAGALHPDSGTVRTPSALRIGYLPQGLEPPAGETIGGYLNRAQGNPSELADAVERLAAELTRAPEDDRVRAEYDDALARLAAGSQNGGAGQTAATLARLGLDRVSARDERFQPQRRPENPARAGRGAAFPSATAAARRAHQSSRPPDARVARGVAQGLPRRRADRLARPRLPRPRREPHSGTGPAYACRARVRRQLLRLLGGENRRTRTAMAGVHGSAAGDRRPDERGAAACAGSPSFARAARRIPRTDSQRDSSPTAEREPSSAPRTSSGASKKS